MPGFDGTGPRGQGPMTGRGLGRCGRGLGFGRGWRWRRYRPADEKEDLKAELEDLKKDQEEVEKRLKELD